MQSAPFESGGSSFGLFLPQDEDKEADREELAAGDWISVSVEIERWNLLVCQLSDLQALTGFITRLTAANHNNKQAVDNSGTPGLSVIGNYYILTFERSHYVQIRFIRRCTALFYLERCGQFTHCKSLIIIL